MWRVPAIRAWRKRVGGGCGDVLDAGDAGGWRVRRCAGRGDLLGAGDAGGWQMPAMWPCGDTESRGVPFSRCRARRGPLLPIQIRVLMARVELERRSNGSPKTASKLTALTSPRTHHEPPRTRHEAARVSRNGH